MTSEPALFDVTPYQVDQPPPAKKLSPDRRRTLRQATDLAAGRHPLTRGPLHPEAAPTGDRTADGRRCGNCWYLTSVEYANVYLKCRYGDGNRVTHGPSTDVRRFWPGCAQHSYGDPQLSPDAARHVPDGTS